MEIGALSTFRRARSPQQLGPRRGPTTVSKAIRAIRWRSVRAPSGRKNVKTFGVLGGSKSNTTVLLAPHWSTDT